MFEKRLRSGIGFGVGLGFVFAARGAEARDIAGAVQVSLGGSLVSYESEKATPDAGQTPAVSDPNALPNVPPSQTTSTTSFGLLGSGLGVGLAYGVSENMSLGIQALILRSNLKSESSDGSNAGADHATSFQILPRFEYLFEGRTGRPFFAAMLGIGTSSSATPVASGGSTDVSSTQFLFGGSAGMHGFLSDTLSTDSGLTLLGASGTQTSKSPGIVFAGFTSAGAEQGYSRSGFQILLTLGLSAWLGGSAHGAPSEPNAKLAGSVKPATAAAAREAPLSVSVALPEQRELDLQMRFESSATSSSTASAPTVAAQLYEWQDGSQLTACHKVHVLGGDAPLKLHITRRGEQAQTTPVRHFVAGLLPVHALTLLARPGSVISVCDQQWPLSPRARHTIHAFLTARYEIGHDESEPLEPEAAPDSAPPADTSPIPDVPAPSAALPAATTPPMVRAAAPSKAPGAASTGPAPSPAASTPARSTPAPQRPALSPPAP